MALNYIKTGSGLENNNSVLVIMADLSWRVWKSLIRGIRKNNR
ncbi:hypothetical protein OFP68_13945 [Brachyspira hyodysenteriae]|nr:hypothetical protein [Brachyspira hyodysenteriae]MCZ9879974.1 hypothetical protein [Brachyspira hyodysenteriae]